MTLLQLLRSSDFGTQLKPIPVQASLHVLGEKAGMQQATL